MIASQFNLDHRLAELRQVGDDRRAVEAALHGTRHPAASTAGTLASVIRSLVGGQVESRPSRIAAH